MCMVMQHSPSVLHVACDASQIMRLLAGTHLERNAQQGKSKQQCCSFRLRWLFQISCKTESGCLNRLSGSGRLTNCQLIILLRHYPRLSFSISVDACCCRRMPCLWHSCCQVTCRGMLLYNITAFFFLYIQIGGVYRFFFLLHMWVWVQL